VTIDWRLFIVATLQGTVHSYLAQHIMKRSSLWPTALASLVVVAAVVCYWWLLNPTLQTLVFPSEQSHSSIGERMFELARDGKCEELGLLLREEKRSHEFVNWRNAHDSNRSPLHRASGNGHVSCVKILLQQPEIDVNARNDDGFTSLLVASYRGHHEIVKILLQNPNILPSINNGDSQGYTPLLCACLAPHLEVLRLLIRQSTLDVNQSSGNGDTGLHMLSRNGAINGLKILLENPNVDMTKLDNDGATALDVALTEEVKNLLLAKIGSSA